MKSETGAINGTGTGTGTQVSMGNKFIYFDFYDVFQTNADSFTPFGTPISNGPTSSSKWNSWVSNVSNVS